MTNSLDSKLCELVHQLTLLVLDIRQLIQKPEKDK